MASAIPVPDDFESCVAHPLDAEDRISAYVEDALRRGIERVVLVGCGGSHFGAYPAYELLNRNLTKTSISHVSSAELIAAEPDWLDEKCLVVLASHSGNTHETVAAAEFCKPRGASLVGISREGDNGLSRLCDIHLDYPNTITITEPKLMHTMLLALPFLRHEGQTQLADNLRSGLEAMPHALRVGKDEIEDVAHGIAEMLVQTGFSYYVGAGAAYGQAKMMAWCYSMEMLWMQAAVINGADFFHGPLELMTDAPLVVLQTEDSYRPLGQRVISFAERYTSKLHVIDSATLSMPGVPTAARGELSVVSMISASRRVLDVIAAHRGHDTSVRRFMYKVAY